MAQFAARAVNEDGLSFAFRLANPNWAGIRERAEQTLGAILEADAGHR